MAEFRPVNTVDSWPVWQRGIDVWPAGVVTGAGAAGVLAGADGATVALPPGERAAPGERVVPAPGAVPLLPQPTANTARQAAEANAAVARKVIISVSLETRAPSHSGAHTLRLMRHG
jgi:hypothetical protein